MLKLYIEFLRKIYLYFIRYLFFVVSRLKEIKTDTIIQVVSAIVLSFQMLITYFQLRHTDYTIMAQLRAYISTDMVVSPIPKKFEDIGSLDFEFEFKNVGQTTAKDVYSDSGMSFFSSRFSPDEVKKFDLPEKDRRDDALDLQPNQISRLPNIFNFKSEYIKEQISRNDKLIVGYGYVRYKDVFERGHYKRFCITYNLEQIMGAIEGSHPLYGTYCGNHLNNGD